MEQDVRTLLGLRLPLTPFSNGAYLNTVVLCYMVFMYSHSYQMTLGIFSSHCSGVRPRVHYTTLHNNYQTFMIFLEGL